MTTTHMKTAFAPAEKAPPEVVQYQIELLQGLGYLKDITDTVSDVYLILNQHRQIVYANKIFCEMMEKFEYVMISWGNDQANAFNVSMHKRPREGAAPQLFVESAALSKPFSEAWKAMQTFRNVVLQRFRAMPSNFV